MFMGEFQNSIDVKGRVIVPARFREELGFRFVLTKGTDGCLFLYSMEEWKRFEEKLKALPFSSKEARAFVRYFCSSAVECEIDKQGRMTIPSNLREHAEIEKDLITIGAMNRVEIWSRDNWNAYTEGSMNPDEITQKMEDLGI